MKHTPGPWRVTEEGYIATAGYGHLKLRSPFRENAFRGMHGEPEEEALANAILGAAAPEMFDALEALLKSIELFGDDEIPLGVALAVLKCREAINKTKGG